MPTYRLQTSLTDRSGLPRDLYVNSLYTKFDAAPSQTRIDSRCAAVGAFYNAIKSYLSPTVAGSLHHTKAYLVGAPLGSPPVSDWPWEISAPVPSGTALPNEVASCLSFHGSPQPGIPRQSWRGRNYLGPLNTNAMASASFGSYVSQSFIDATLAAAQTLAAALNEGDGAWVINSKTRGVVFPVAEFSMDDAWDTMRSRGNRARSVTTLVIPGGGGGSGSF